MNVALHGFEEEMRKTIKGDEKPTIVRYADDLVILHKSLDVISALQERAEVWLAAMGLRLKASKTHITHTLYPHEGRVGFDFLGFTVRQFPVGKYHLPRSTGKVGFKTLIKPSKTGVQRHRRDVKQVILEHRTKTQWALIRTLTLKGRGWANYYRTAVATRTFNSLDSWLQHQLFLWARERHPRKTSSWRHQRNWRRIQGRIIFSDSDLALRPYADTKVRRHVKVRGDKSPFDGDWVYWATRLGREPTKPDYLTALLKQQRGKCYRCGLPLTTEDIIEVHHKNRNRRINFRYNLALLHGHCHQGLHAERDGEQYS
jgi:RNA-directed DNA polymerase